MEGIGNPDYDPALSRPGPRRPRILTGLCFWIPFGFCYFVAFAGFISGCTILAFATQAQTSEKWLEPVNCSAFIANDLNRVAVTLPGGLVPVGKPEGPLVMVEATSEFLAMADLPCLCYLNMCKSWAAYYVDGIYRVCPLEGDRSNVVPADHLYVSNDLSTAKLIAGGVMLGLWVFGLLLNVILKCAKDCEKARDCSPQVMKRSCDGIVGYLASMICK